LVRRCLTNSALVLQIEEPHQLKIRQGKPLTELGGKAFRQFLDDRLAIRSAIVAALFLFYDASADLEIGVHLDQIHAARDGGSGTGDQVADAVKEFGRGFHGRPRRVSGGWPAARGLF
jgi:hypothetical protein